MSAITLAAALEAVRLGEATQAHAAVLAHGLEEREADVHARVRAGYDRTIADTWREEVSRRDIEIVALRAQRDAALEEQRRAVARVAELSAELEREAANRTVLLSRLHDARTERDHARGELERDRAALVELVPVRADRDLLAAEVERLAGLVGTEPLLAAELERVRAERDRLLAAAVAQADAAGSPFASRFEGHMAWLAATTATEALASELRGAR